MMSETKGNSKEQIVIVGFGWVGQANGLALSQMGYQVSYFDPNPPKHHYEDDYAEDYRHIKRLGKVSELDSDNTWYVVCVGDRVSEDGVQDIAFIRNALDSLRGLKGGVILRSTILPETLKDLKFDCYVPEFLHEKKAVEECINPLFFVVGKRKGSRPTPSFFRIWRTSSERNFSGTPEEASYVKYLSNIWNAVRIAFVNEFGDAIVEPKTKEDIESIQRIVSFVFGTKPYLRYGRAFGGHCLPKDTRAFARFLRDTGRNAALLDGTYRSNTIHESAQGKYPLLPEWFSFWAPPVHSGREALIALRHSIVNNIKNPRALVARILRR